MRMKALLGGVGFAALLLVAIPLAQAQPWEGGSCRDRIERAEARLDRDIDHWGRHSDAARAARRHLEDVRDWCRQRHEHGWFDSHEYHEHGWDHDH